MSYEAKYRKPAGSFIRVLVCRLWPPEPSCCYGFPCEDAITPAPVLSITGGCLIPPKHAWTGNIRHHRRAAWKQEEKMFPNFGFVAVRLSDLLLYLIWGCLSEMAWGGGGWGTGSWEQPCRRRRQDVSPSPVGKELSNIWSEQIGLALI